MKTKSIFVLVALMAFNILQSCDKFLEEKLVSDVAAGYYQTAAGLEDAVDATYYYLKFVYSNERAYSLTVFGTDAYTNGADGGYKGFNFYDNTLKSDVDILQQFWQYSYQGVNQANAVIGRAEAVKDMPEATKTIRVAEARFLRALYLFNLTRHWGDIPMNLVETIGAVVEAPKVAQADVYANGIIPDLEFAITNLPATQSDYGRATKGAANHLMGLVKLTRGYQSFAKSTDFAEAEAAFTAVIGGPYALAPDYAKLFDQDNQKNSEVIFAVQNSTNVLLNSGGDGVLPGEGNRGHLYFLMQYDIQPGMSRNIANGRPFKRFRPTDYLLNLWAADRTIDNRYDLSYRHVWLANNAPPDVNNYPKWTAQNVADGAYKWDATTKTLVQITSADVGQQRFFVGDTAIYIPGPGNEAAWTLAKIKKTRYKVFTRTPNLVNTNGVVSTSTSYDEFNFAHTNKFADPRRPTIQWQEGSRDFFVMRLADTYLLRAEARLAQGATTTAAADINVVRTRAAKPGQTAAMQITPAAVTLSFILDERAKELDGEQSRWYDLTRTNTLVQRVRTYNVLATPNIQNYHVRRPYPQTQIDRTLPAGSFVQNCGYPGGPTCN